jgi:hypothetical protein
LRDDLCDLGHRDAELIEHHRGEALHRVLTQLAARKRRSKFIDRSR